VIDGLADMGVPISVDTRHADVMRRAIDAGAGIVNDVTALTGDPESLEVCAEAGVDVALMHMQGTPETMQDNPTYEDAALDIVDYMQDRLDALAAAGIARDKVCIDPGVGFGKTLEHNLRILSAIDAFHELGVPASFPRSTGMCRPRTGSPVPLPPRSPAGTAACSCSGCTTWPKRARPWRSGRRSRTPRNTRPL
jgi:dihydropteroate synthase